MIAFGRDAPRRRIALTPMIDVVFLLLVFFMLASRFGHERVVEFALAGGAGAGWSGPPRLVDIGAGAAVRLNGVATRPEALPAALAALMQAPMDPVVLRASGGTAQDLLAVMAALQGAGITTLALVEAADAP